MKLPRPVGRYGMRLAAPPVRVVPVHAGSAAFYKLPRAVPVARTRLEAFQVRLKLPLFITFVKRRRGLVHLAVVAIGELFPPVCYRFLNLFPGILLLHVFLLNDLLYLP